MVRIGIVGAGANTRLRHLPGFAQIHDVDVVGVVNRTKESTQRIANEYGIERTYESWQQLVSDDIVDAVMIGTWPNLHCEITCAALQAGKHVLTEARMARDFSEATQMAETAAAHPNLVTQIVPSPFGLEHHDAVTKLLDDGFLGDLREVVVVGADSSFHDSSQPLHWRQDRSISGNNILAMGILHETLVRWAPHPSFVYAQSQTFEPTRSADGVVQAVSVPDSLQIVTQFQVGSQTGRGLYHLSGVALHGPQKQIHLYGSEGTIKVIFGNTEEVWIGNRHDSQLNKLQVSESERGGWRVEAEFIGAIRGEEPIRFTPFSTGLRYMQFTDAVAKSYTESQPIAVESISSLL